MIKPHPVRRYLESPTLFRGLTKPETNVISAAAVERKFEVSEIIVRCTEPAKHLFVVLNGYVNYSVLTSDGREILVDRLGRGDVFGLTAFLSELVYHSGTATAVHKTEVLTWESQMIRQLAHAYPRLAENALSIALRSVACHRDRHIDLISKTARERIATVLSSLGTRVGRVLSDGIEIEIKNEDLASLADVNVFTASRILQVWERKGVLAKSRGRILIRFPEKLFAA